MSSQDAALRVVLDTNVLISAFIRPKGVFAQIRLSGFYEQFIIVQSRVLLEELKEVLARPRVKKVGQYSDREATEFFELLELAADVISGPLHVPSVIAADPDDDWVLATAIEGKANLIVSGDKHLLSLGSHEGISIITPAVFSAVFLEELKKSR